MTKDETDILAAEYVLGTLEATERDAFAHKMAGDSELQALVADWERRLAPLAEAVPPAAPPTGLWEKIAARLPGADGKIPGTTTIREDEGDWTPMAPGVEMKLLFRDPEAGMRSFLVRFAAGARFGGHPHQRFEECLVLEGDLAFGDLRLRAGDYHLVTPGAEHPVAVSQGGCLLFLRGEIREAA